MRISRKIWPFRFFLLLISFFSFSCQNTENSPPVPGVITHFTDVTSNTMVMYWTNASDADTYPNHLEYMVLTSRYNNLDTLSNALANGSVITYDDPETEEVEAIQWNRDIRSLYLSFVGFADGQTYYFTVIVRDAAWRQSVYPMASQKTIDITPPVVGGEITIINETDGTLELEWPAATDNGTNQDELEYKVVSSNQDNIDTVSGAEKNGDVLPDWDWKTIANGLFPVIVNSPNTVTEFFNILVRDSDTDTANISVYKAVSRKPTPGGLGKVTAEDITTDSCTLTWEPATDFRTAQTDLLYKVVQSGKEEPVLPWRKNIKTVNVTGLNSDSSYTFSVSVQDADGYEVVYSNVQVRTLEESSQTQSPVNRSMMSLPEGSGGVFSVSESLGSYDDISFADMISPLEIAGNGHLVVWLDGADISGTGSFYEGPVSIWKDKSGMGNHAEQVIAGQQPVSAYSSLFDNKRVLRFDAGNRNHMIVRLGADLDIAKSLEGYTVFLVAGTGSKIPDNLFSEGCYFVGKDDSSDFLGLFDENLNGDFKISVKTSLDQLIDIPDPPSLFVASLTYEQSNHGPGVFLRIMDASCSSPVFTKPESIHEILLGASSDHSGFLNGEMAEFIVFDRVLNEDEQQRVNQYLEKKWGIQEPVF